MKMRRATNSEPDPVASVLYGAAVHPERWPKALRGLQSALREAGTLLFSLDREQRVPFLASVDLSDQVLKEYREHYIKQCPKIACQARHPGERNSYDCGYIDERAIDHDEYDDWLRRVSGTRCFIGSQLRQEGGHKLLIGIKRTREAEHEQRPDISLYERLAAYLERAVLITRRFGFFEDRARGLEGALNASAGASIVLDAGARIVFASSAAQKIFAACDGLLAASGGLRAANPDDDARLQQAVSRALAPDPLQAGEHPGIVTIARPTGRRAYFARVLPLRPEPSESTAIGQARVAIFVSDPDRQIDAEALPLGALYGLTGTEARVAAALASGRTLAEVAAAFGITRNTARLHLNRALQKTGTHRQSELVRLLLNLAASAG